MVRSCVRWIQLHPGYGYEEFIRGLRLDGSATQYEPGALPKIIEEMGAQVLPDGLAPLPFVLVLDEINRTDLSALFGEAFSLIERDKRGEPGAELPGLNVGDPAARLVIPEDLYIIGTMNEIDQSVETLDFALRRRFLWRECPFERDTLLSIVFSRWPDDVGKRWSEEARDPQLERFADRAGALNQAIDDSDELGRAYQVGHTYFADITFFLGTWLSSRKSAPPNGTFLWTGGTSLSPRSVTFGSDHSDPCWSSTSPAPTRARMSSAGFATSSSTPRTRPVAEPLSSSTSSALLTATGLSAPKRTGGSRESQGYRSRFPRRSGGPSHAAESRARSSSARSTGAGARADTWASCGGTDGCSRSVPVSGRHHRGVGRRRPQPEDRPPLGRARRHRHAGR